MLKRVFDTNFSRQAAIVAAVAVAGWLSAGDRGTASVWRASFFVAAFVALLSWLAFLAERRRSAVVSEMVEIAECVAQGDLSRSIPEAGTEETRVLCAAMNRMIEGLRTIVRHVQKTGEEIDALSVEAFDISSSFAACNEEQASSVEETAGTVDTLTQSVAAIAENVGRVKVSSARTLETVVRGRGLLEESVRSIGSMQERIAEVTRSLAFLQEKSGEIETVIGSLEGIAKNTRLISFNASLEAVAAGGSGSRFAVVAEEIRRLALDAKGQMAGVQKTISMVMGAIREAADASDACERAGREARAKASLSSESFEEIVGMIRNLDEASGSIAESVQEQGAAHRQVSDTAQHLAASVQGSANDMQTYVALVSDLMEKAESLSMIVSGITCPKDKEPSAG